MQASNEKVSVIVPVFNKIEIIEQCIQLNIVHSALQNEWIIIDNHSDTSTKQGLLRLKTVAETHHHSFHILTEQENTGVAKAWNKGLKWATQAYVCILNNDCVLMPEWDRHLIRLNKHYNVAISTPFVLEPWMFKTEYTLALFLQSIKNFQYFSKKNTHRVRYGTFGGVVLFGEKKYFNLVGVFDENFWLSLEDYDYLLRTNSLGLRTAIMGAVTAFHYSGLSRNQMNKIGEAQNQKYFESKWGWNFEKTEQKFPNKQIRSIQKFTFKNFGWMSTLNLVFPKKSKPVI